MVAIYHSSRPVRLGANLFFSGRKTTAKSVYSQKTSHFASRKEIHEVRKCDSGNSTIYQKWGRHACTKRLPTKSRNRWGKSRLNTRIPPPLQFSQISRNVQLFRLPQVNGWKIGIFSLLEYILGAATLNTLDQYYPRRRYSSRAKMLPNGFFFELKSFPWRPDETFTRGNRFLASISNPFFGIRLINEGEFCDVRFG